MKQYIGAFLLAGALVSCSVDRIDDNTARIARSMEVLGEDFKGFKDQAEGELTALNRALKSMSRTMLSFDEQLRLFTELMAAGDRAEKASVGEIGVLEWAERSFGELEYTVAEQTRLKQGRDVYRAHHRIPSGEGLAGVGLLVDASPEQALAIWTSFDDHQSFLANIEYSVSTRVIPDQSQVYVSYELIPLPGMKVLPYTVVYRFDSQLPLNENDQAFQFDTIDGGGGFFQENWGEVRFRKVPWSKKTLVTNLNYMRTKPALPDALLRLQLTKNTRALARQIEVLVQHHQDKVKRSVERYRARLEVFNR